jgi:hypothetical protein
MDIPPFTPIDTVFAKMLHRPEQKVPGGVGLSLKMSLFPFAVIDGQGHAQE